MTCPHCCSADTTEKEATRKDAQRYRYHNCDSISNDLTETIFSNHKPVDPNDQLMLYQEYGWLITPNRMLHQIKNARY